VWTDARFALRALLKARAFSFVAVVTLALGIGATMAIFTVLERVALRPLPYPQADRLVAVQSRVPGIKPDAVWGLATAELFYFQQYASTLEAIGMYSRFPATFGVDPAAAGQPAERVYIANVSESVLPLLGARPLHGRLLTTADTRAATPAAIVLARALWVQRFNSDAGIVGRAIDIDGRPVEVVGVLDEGVEVPGESEMSPFATGAWMPMALNPNAPAVNSHVYMTIARLKANATLASAQGEIDRLTSHLPGVFPSAYSPAFMHQTRFATALVPLRDDVVGSMARVLWVLMGAVGLVFVIAGANVANLFLVRTEARRRELAIRTALGATRGTLARYALVESLLLSLGAAAAGTAVAYAGLRLLVATSPSTLPRVTEVRLDWTGLVCGGSAAVVSALVLGVVSIARSNGADVAALRQATHTASPGQHVIRNALVVGQVALALMLLTAAGLMAQSVRNLLRVRPGFDASRVLTFQVSLPHTRYPSYVTVAGFYRTLSDRLTALPGVENAGASQSIPLSGDDGCSLVWSENEPVPRGTMPPCVGTLQVAPGYFRTLSIPVHGRAPDWADTERQTGEAVVSEALARRLWPGQDAIGKGIKGNGGQRPYYRVVGVAGDVRANGLDRPPLEAVYFPMLPLDGAPLWAPPRAMTIVVRTRTDDPSAILSSVRHVLADVDPNVPLANARTMEERVAKSLSRTSFTMLLLTIAAGMAVLLSAIGLYGAVTYVVSRRQAEFGIRLALGAPAAGLGRSIVFDAVKLAACGVACGVAGAWTIGRVLMAFLFEVAPTDAPTLTAVAALLIVVAAAASYGPARRAMRVDPIVALRAE
jgi:putative ABC transport system permease protein